MAAAPVQFIGANQHNATANTIAVTVPVGGVSAGNYIFVWLGWNATGNDPTGITDTAGNTYTQDKAETDTHTSTKKATLWSAPVTNALVSGNSITASWAAGPSRASIMAMEFSGIISSPVDVSALNNSAGSATIDAGSVATGHADELWLMCGLQTLGASTSFTLTADGSWTALSQTESTNAASSNIGLCGEYQVVSATGTMHPAPTSSINAAFAACCVAYQATSSGVPANTVAPAITGNKWNGQTLTCSTGTWTNSPSSYAYQWKRGVTNIGTNSANYTLTGSEVGQSVTCVVTATNGSGSTSATSNAITGGAAYTALTRLGTEFCDFRTVTYTPGTPAVPPPAPPFALPVLSVRIAPGSSATDANPSWTEVAVQSDGSSLLREFTFTRGRQTELDNIEVGTASIVFNNSTRFLDPAYTVGPFYPRLLPNMQVSVQATFGTTTYDLFRGHIERFVTSYDGPNYAGTTLECVDRLAALSRAQITGTFNEQHTGDRILAVIAAAGWPTTVSPSGWTLDTSMLNTDTTLGATVPVNDLDVGRATVAAVTFLAADEKTATDHIQEVTDSEPGRFFFDGEGVGVFQDRSHVAPIPDPSAITLTDDPDGISYQAIVLNYEIDQISNDISLVAIDTTTAASVQDTVSIDRYYRRSLQRQTQLRPYDSDIQSQANWLLTQKKDPKLRVLEVSALAFDDATFNALLPRELGDHVTVVRTPPGDTSETINQPSAIERLTVTAAPGPAWSFKFELSPLPDTLEGWTLDLSALETESVLVFA